MTTTLLHLGLAKTATTYLQKSVFPQARGVNYLGKPFRTPARAVRHALSHREWQPPLDGFLKEEAALRSRETGYVSITRRQLRRALSVEDLNVWSHEGFLRPTRDTAPFARERALRNLRDVFAAAGSDRIDALLILRDTRALMASYARQFLHELDSRGLADCDPADLHAARARGGSDTSSSRLWDLWYCYFDFGALISDLHAVFGAGHVHVLNYDVLAQDWGGLQGVVASVHPDARLVFPNIRVNVSHEKPADPSPRLAQHLKMLEALDLSLLYPENASHLARAAR